MTIEDETHLSDRVKAALATAGASAALAVGVWTVDTLGGMRDELATLGAAIQVLAVQVDAPAAEARFRALERELEDQKIEARRLQVGIDRLEGWLQKALPGVSPPPLGTYTGVD